MVFPSLPVYLDPPNWQPLENQRPVGNGSENPDQVPHPPPPATGGGGGGGTASIRPGSMTDRARLAKIPQPEAGLKCPRCESTNTKFCYFNNYNLSQPRHFCKTCRRYWTRGGALRNVPVGGGCRRNKRSKNRNRSKSPAPERQLIGSTSTTAVSHQSHLPFLPSLQQFSDYGLNLGVAPPPAAAAASGGGVTGGGADIEFQGLQNSSSCVTTVSEHWRLQQAQQFPFLANWEQPTVLYTFDSPETAAETTRYNLGGAAGQLGFSKLHVGNNGMAQVGGAVKMEENKGFNLPKNFQFWPGGGNSINAWAGADISGFSSSSTSHLL